MKNTERFSTKAENYVKYRPQYPAAVIPFLVSAIGLSRDTVVADIGAGTGISAQPFLDNGNKVYAVEPNPEMMAMAEAWLHGRPGFIPIPGTAEATTLPDAAVNLIVAATAFHWFSHEAALKEFRRIARENTYMVLMWNIRRSELPFEKEYEALLLQYGNDYKDMQHRNVGTDRLSALFLPGTFQEKSFQNAQIFDFQAFKGRLLSSSYVPEMGAPNYEPMIQALQKLFEQYQEQGMVRFHYETKLYIGKIK
ncbi:class I SAM-dependent methyltransferase [Chitinophaga sp. 30R24]|uniref:class I SAM-dependent methyltransferase n=1 Tax=Chitinophaga sp. 30R24 TaxID=3248838 RepID=UPI003B900B2F